MNETTRQKPDTEPPSARAVPLAIVGIGCLFPKAGDAGTFWTNIRDGVDAITDIPASHWKPEDYFDTDPNSPDMTYARRGGFIDAVAFDPLLYGLSPNNIEATDTTQLLGMVVARQALLDAGYATGKDTNDGRPFDRDRTSVILGVTGTLELVIPLGARLGHPIWRKALADAGVSKEVADEVVQRIAEGYVPWQENSFPGLLGNVAAGRIANRFDLGGTNCVVDAACASSLSAIHMAAMELYAGRSDMAISGGFDTFNDIFMYMCFSKTPALSPTGNSRPFDQNGDGTILGEGLGAVILKRLDDAQRDHDHIYAIIKGIGSSSDGRGNAIYAPSAGGQTKALKNAYQDAGISPVTVELVEAHGTGTRVGDAVEAEALSAVYREQQKQGCWCAIGSVKSMIGHTKAAAGVAGLIKVAMALRNKVLPPTIKVEQPLGILEPGTAPVYVNTHKRPWIKNPRYPRRAALSAFGFGGSNFHCVLEEAEPDKAMIEWDGKVVLYAFSNAVKNDLLSDLQGIDSKRSWNNMRADAARSLQSFNPEQQHRLLLVVTGHTDLDKLVENTGRLLQQNDKSFWGTPEGAFYGSGKQQGKLAMLFPGQGSQYPDMLLDLACQFPQLQGVLAAADTVFQAAGNDTRLTDLIYPIPVFTDAARREQTVTLRATQYAQPAIGAVSLGALEVLRYFGVIADATAGHSFGELTALHAAGRISDEDLHRLAIKRGDLMRISDGDRGAMLAVAASAAVVHEFLEAEQLDLIIANNNAPAQVVLSGATDQIERAMELLKKRGLGGKRLDVSAGFHSSFVTDAEKPLAEFLVTIKFNQASVPVYANTTAVPYPADGKHARTLLAGQLAQPVEFVAQIENMYADGITTFVEVGPGKTLSGLVQSILGNREHHAFSLDISRGQHGGQFDLACLLAQLAAVGRKVDLAKWDAGYLQSYVDEEANKPGMTISINGANYVKPRPKRELAKALSRSDASRQLADTDVQLHSDEIPVNDAAVVDVGTSDVNRITDALHVTQQTILALQKMQEQTAQLHRQYLQGQEAAQQTIQQLIQQQQQLLSGTTLTPLTTVQQTTTAAAPNVDIAQADVKVTAKIAEPEPATPARHPERSIVDHSFYENLLLEVVADKTGYPVEMLSMDMSLDTDLGIDSIKRVEILSALQEKLPGIRKIQPEDLGTFQLLTHIVEFLAADTRVESTINTITAAPAPLVQDTGLQNTLLDVVADKTGYPVEMLNLGMNLDTDLGIDSIKRVEILSAFQERMPDAPAVNPEDLAALQTLQQIVDYMQGGTGKTAAPVTASAVQDKAPNTDTILYRSTVEITPLAVVNRVGLQLTQDSNIWIIDDGTDLPANICTAFQERNIPALVVPLDATPDVSVTGVIIPAPVTAGDQFIEAVFLLLQRLSGCLKQHGREDTAVLIGITRLGGTFGIGGISANNPLVAGLAGMIKTADKEWPGVHCKVIDIDSGSNDNKLATAIVAEILTDGPLETGIRGDERYTVTLNPETVTYPDNPASPFNKGDVVVVTGGARGVTAEVAITLAKQFHTNLLLIGRSALPDTEPGWLQGLDNEAVIKQAIVKRSAEEITPREVEQEYQRIVSAREVMTNLQRIRDTGVEVIYQSVDVRDADAVVAAVDSARNNLGPVTGIVHGAGILADRLIEDKTLEQFRQVYSTKVDGLRTLLVATEHDDLKIAVMFSSSTARYGRKGQADYAAANEILNKVAQQQQEIRAGCRVVSINWGPWDGGMVTPHLKNLFASEGVGTIPLQAGADYLMGEIVTDGPVELVVLGSEPKQGGNELKGIDAALQLAFERKLTLEDYPVLRSHVMNGNAVLPAALIAEWLAHGAIHNNPGLSFTGFNNLRILKGVILQAEERVDLQIMAGHVVIGSDSDRVPVELRSGSTLHARAEIVLGNAYQQAPDAVVIPVSGEYPCKDREYYSNGQLFHGPLLQGLASIESCTKDDISGLALSAPAPSQWITQPVRSAWLADPLILDCSFQMMILWSFQQWGTGCLPTAIGRYRQYRERFPQDGVQIFIHINNQSKHAASATIEFQDKDANVIARIDDYECVIDASLNEAFKRNALEVQI